MEGTRIVLVRHGESRAQELRIVGGHNGCQGLSDRGRRQVAALRDRWASSDELGDAPVLYASIMPRAYETATVLAPALGVSDIVQDCDLCEHHAGDGDGLAWDEYERRYPVPATGWDVHTRRDPGGETWFEMEMRVRAGLDRLAERHPGRTVVVATHGGVVVQSMVRWFGLEPGGAEGRAWMSPANASITEWRYGPNPYGKKTGGIELFRFNDHAHLVSPA